MEQTEIENLKPINYKWRILDATMLKLLAAALMLLDHIHQMFVHVGAPIWLTMAGRLVFPIFLFAASESFYYTHSKQRYLKRLLFASWGMTAFTLLLQKIVPNENVVLMNNAFSTFFLAGLYMLLWDYFVEGVHKKETKQVIKAIFYCFIPFLGALPLYLATILSFNENVSISVIRLLITASFFVPNILSVEGGYSMVALGVAFYIFRNHRLVQIAALLILSGIVYMVGGGIQWMMCFAAIPILMYNHKRGRGMKNFFYIFYPAHIGLLYILSAAL